MKPLLLILAVALSLPLLPGCATKDVSAQEWQRAECNRINDQEARERCLKRVG